MAHVWETDEIITAEKLNTLETAANNIITVWFINNTQNGTHTLFQGLYYGNINNNNKIIGIENRIWRETMAPGIGTYGYTFPLFNPENDSLILWGIPTPTSVNENCTFYQDISLPNNSWLANALVITGNCIIEY